MILVMGVFYMRRIIPQRDEGTGREIKMNRKDKRVVQIDRQTDRKTDSQMKKK